MNIHCPVRALIGAAVLLLAGGGAGGWFLAKRPATATPRADPGSKRFRYVLGEPEVFSRIPALADWEYPQTKGGYFGCGGCLFPDGWEHEGTCCADMTTDDDIDRVWAYYRTTCRIREARFAPPDSPFARLGPPARSGSKNREVTLFDDRDAQPMDGFGKDSAEVRAFYVHARFYQLVGLIHRPKGSTETKIRITYRPLREFATLIRDRIEDTK